MRLVKSCVLREIFNAEGASFKQILKKTQMVTMQVSSSLPTKSTKHNSRTWLKKLDSEANFELLNTFKVLGE